MLGLIWSRYTAFNLIWISALACAALGALVSPVFYWALIALAPLTAIGVADMLQTRHAVLRNYPVIGHIRFILESIRPEIRQYLIEDDRDPIPFSREQRALVYQRAKDELDKRPFGSIRDMAAPGFGWIAHSMRPVELHEHDFRVVIGGPDCKQPYAASVLNISGTSFGAVSGNAIEAFNKGAAIGNFAHNTGEGSISRYHRKHGGDIIWQVATGYFGCRTFDGRFDEASFARQARDPQIKMIEIKLSQGAKPGHGGVLPMAKISAEIAQTRGVPRDRDCVSPAAHSEFSSPREMMAFVARLRALSGGKPVGLKFCVGHRFEVLALIKAMLATGVTPDFIVIDGAEGGTGAAPLELADHVGLPLADGLNFVANALVGAGLRERVKLGASGKIINAYDIARAYALGADYVLSARGFMFAVGCIQARSCHSNKCPTGVATQSRMRQRALVVEDKAVRVARFHSNTLKALAQVLGAAGLSHPNQIRSMHFHIRQPSGGSMRGDDVYPHVAPNALVTGGATGVIAREWTRASADTFAPLEMSDKAASPTAATANVA
jgi:glutamate synthase domain-containing protein 2